MVNGIEDGVLTDFFDLTDLELEYDRAERKPEVTQPPEEFDLNHWVFDQGGMNPRSP